MRAVGTQATPEVIETWGETHKLFQEFRGERRERLQEVADRLGVSFKVARRRLRNYEALMKTERAPKEAEDQPQQVRQEARPQVRQEVRQEARSVVNTEFQDRTLTCADCAREFTWSAGEQAFFKEKGLTSEPKRCKECRQTNERRRAERDSRKGENR